MSNLQASSEFKVAPEVWLAGKGPSLDSYDWSKAGDDRICINETVFVVPNPSAAIALDYVVLDKYLNAKLDVLVLRKSSHINYHFKYMWEWCRKDHLPINEAATAPIAVQLAYYAGARKIHFVGFDAIFGDSLNYAASIKNIKAEGKSRDQYSRINKALLEAVEKLNIEAVWEGQE